MIPVLVTGSQGFVGRNLCSVLRTMAQVRVMEFDCDNTLDDLERMLGEAEVVFHLAGVNRPKNEDEFRTGNAGLTEALCSTLRQMERTPKIMLASSIQAELDNPYGQSKLLAEQALRGFSDATGARTVVYRFKNLFGKWCRPNYNSVTATFCHNIAHDLPVTISDPARAIELTYIDDVVLALTGEIPSAEARSETGFAFGPDLVSHSITLGELAELIGSFRQSRQTLVLPGFDSRFVRALYATYLSYLDGDDFAYLLTIRSDERGSLAEMMKSGSFGQIFVSRTKPGITRGNHYHHTKTEKFMVVEGDALIRFRRIDGTEVIEHRVAGREFRVVDIPPGYTHHITNIGNTELVTLFWASEMFNPEKPDTYFLPV
ncbi:MAG: SDR family oxidoreductase [Desulfobulbaceae bacterium]|nr:SDR family oxidoreductase [Desulfobulbaceae bacterium]